MKLRLHFYYIVLEALANAAKHSSGSNVDITLQPSGDRWLLDHPGRRHRVLSARPQSGGYGIAHFALSRPRHRRDFELAQPARFRHHGDVSFSARFARIAA